MILRYLGSGMWSIASSFAVGFMRAWYWRAEAVPENSSTKFWRGGVQDETNAWWASEVVFLVSPFWVGTRKSRKSFRPSRRKRMRLPSGRVAWPPRGLISTVQRASVSACTESSGEIRSL
jgi:hypothetical protein